MTTTVAAPWTSAAFEEFLATRNEPAWLTDRRRQAFAAYQELLKQPLDPEEFKRIDLRGLRPEKFSLAGNGNSASLSTLMANRADFGGTVSHIDGRAVASQLRPELAAKGVVFGSWESVLASRPEILQALERAVPADTDRFSAWHTAFCTGGTVLYVPRNLQVDVPLYSLIGLATNGAADLSHTLVVLEEGASATLLEETASLDPNHTGLHVGAVELLVAPRAVLRYVQLQNWGEKVWHLGHQAGRVANDASLQWTVGGLGAKVAHIHQDIHLDGKGAAAEVNGVTFATDKQVL
ncbi:MAG TPA: SufD family Fe-S cluster assembly protein, partial [Planctomycetaceae bacterium]|nr:SufD family Fe-S cluster assembly protein [Planctomycetaceae bacterium]